MGTSPYNEGRQASTERRMVNIGDATLEINGGGPDVQPAVIAAITGAIQAHLAAEAEVVAGSDTHEREWAERAWQFAGRTELVFGQQVRPPPGGPTDYWRAAARLDR